MTTSTLERLVNELVIFQYKVLQKVVARYLFFLC